MSQSEPASQADLRALLLAHLDRHRDGIIDTVKALPDGEATRSRLPSGWTPAQLLNHLMFMEQRWFIACFEGAEVDDVWGDWQDGRWRTPTEPVAILAQRLREVGRTTRLIVENHTLDDVAKNYTSKGKPSPHLHWILIHVLQEYARHAGHVDIVSELAKA